LRTLRDKTLLILRLIREPQKNRITAPAILCGLQSADLRACGGSDSRK